MARSLYTKATQEELEPGTAVAHFIVGNIYPDMN
jgi:hypothetical protein